MKLGFPGARLRAALLLAAATTLAYARVLRFGFIDYDDGAYVTQNPHVKAGLTGSNVLWAFTTSHAANWHPLTWLSHMLDCQLFGMDPPGHHAMSLLLHLANVLVLAYTLDRMTGKLWRSALVAGLFALHPLHVESVAWIAERKDVLSSVFWILTILAWTRYAERPGRLRYLAALGLFTAGLLCKPMVVTLPFVLLILDFWPLERVRSLMNRMRVPTLGRLVAEKIPFLVLSAVSSIVTLAAQRSGGAIASADEVPPLMRLTNALVSCSGYLLKTVWPAHLAVFYPLPASPPILPASASAVVLAALTVLALRAAGRRPYLAAGWLWYLGTLVPVLGFVQVGLQSMADRYTYIPLIGIFILAVWGAADVAAGWRYAAGILTAASVFVLGASMLLTVRQLGSWRSSEALFEQVFRAGSGSYVTHYHLANVLAGEGKIDEAIDHYEQAVRLEPRSAAVHNNLGLVLAGQKRLELAAGHYREALRIKPDYAEAHNNLGFVLANQGRRAGAIAEYTEALRIKPAYPQAHNNLGVALGNEGKQDEGLEHVREAIRLDPDFADARLNLGYLLGLQGNLDGAITQFVEALRRAPQSAQGHYYLAMALAARGRSREAILEFREALRANSDWPEALTGLARILATDGDLTLRNGPEAVLLAERASVLTGHQQLPVLDTLASSYAQAGRWREAAKTAGCAIEIARSSGQAQKAAELGRRLEQYRARGSQGTGPSS